METTIVSGLRSIEDQAQEHATMLDAIRPAIKAQGVDFMEVENQTMFGYYPNKIAEPNRWILYLGIIGKSYRNTDGWQPIVFHSKVSTAELKTAILALIPIVLSRG